MGRHPSDVLTLPAVPPLDAILAGFGLPAQSALPGLAAVVLLSLRIAVVLAFSPLLYSAAIPLRARVLVVLALSAALALSLTPPAGLAMPLPGGLGAWIAAALAEMALGLTFALGILLAFAAISIAGHLLDIQIGFGIAQVFDPVSNRQTPLLTSAFNQLALVLFFLVDGHHALLRGIAYSLERFPVGSPWSLADAAGPVLRQAAGLFLLGFALAAPVVFCILLVELALGVVSRNLPQMNMFALGIPVKLLAGIAALSFWFAGMGGAMTRAYAGIFTTWSEVFAAPAPAPTPVPAPGATAGAR